MTDGEKGWLAGIIDGEGCISVSLKRKTGDKKIPYYVLTVSVVNTDKPMINKIIELYGGSISFKKTKSNRKDYWKWEVAGKTAWVFLEIILPFLVTKKERGRIAISLGKRVSKRMGYKVIGSGYQGLGGASICKDELCIRHDLMNQLRFINSGTKHLLSLH